MKKIILLLMLISNSPVFCQGGPPPPGIPEPPGSPINEGESALVVAGVILGIRSVIKKNKPNT